MIVFKPKFFSDTSCLSQLVLCCDHMTQCSLMPQNRRLIDYGPVVSVTAGLEPGLIQFICMNGEPEIYTLSLSLFLVCTH